MILKAEYKMSCFEMHRALLQICTVVLFASLVISIQPPLMPKFDHLNAKPKIENLNKISLKGKPVPPCVACRSLVKSFLTAVDKTTRQSFAGGDADWEKQKLGTYENSELRFIEIQEMLCADVELGKDQCYNLAEHHESELEDWFYEKRKKNIDLYELLCISSIKVCCPDNTYGPNCIPCPGGVDKPCGGHGKCKKGGTREEPANCVCEPGYTGDICSECEKGYYQVLDTNTNLSCKKCSKACKGYCRGPGPKNCEVCASGYHFLSDTGCVEDSSIKIENEEITSEQTLSEIKQSAQVNSSNESTKKGEPIKLKTAVEDSTANLQHSEF